MGRWVVVVEQPAGGRLFAGGNLERNPRKACGPCLVSCVARNVAACIHHTVAQHCFASSLHA